MVYLILFCLVIGVILGSWSRMPGLFFQISERLTSLGLIFLLFCMGASLGSHPGIVSQLRWIGFKALVHAACTVAGSILVVWGIERCIASRKEAGCNKPVQDTPQ